MTLANQTISSSMTIRATTWHEIRAAKDRNRLLAMYDPQSRTLRLFNRGEVLTIDLTQLDPPPREPIETSGRV